LSVKVVIIRNWPPSTRGAAEGVASTSAKGLNMRIMALNPSIRFNRGERFGQEIDAVSVRKAKNIASEVERKRTNRITLRFASSIGLPPFPHPGRKEQY
jgi:hypothetical protein